MKNKVLLIWFCFISLFSTGQKAFFSIPDTISSKRSITTTSLISTSWLGGTAGLYSVWYKEYSSSNFHFFNDGNEWLQMDKVGHLYTTNKLALQLTDFYKWSGYKNNKAAIIGTSIGLGFQSTLEILDGFSSGWGFSLLDMGSNTIGAASFLSQEILLKDQLFILKFSSHRTNYAQLRPDVLGANFSERLLKDYNGQTYWISFNPSRFFQSTKIPKWVCLSLGYSVDQKIIGNDNYYTDAKTLINYHAKREFLMSLDVDFSKIPIKRPWLKAFVKQFNYIKIPFPTLILSDGKMIAKGIYF